MTVFRTGTFPVTAPEVEGKCGVFGKTEFRYDVWFTATGEDLDARGFVVDNADLHRYFTRKYGQAGSPFVSCELMGIGACQDFQELWPMVREIKVRVWGADEVTYVETKWKRPTTLNAGEV